MQLEEKVLEKFRRLPAESQQQVLDFVEFLNYKRVASLDTILADIRARSRQIDSSELDALIEEARTDFYQRHHEPDGH